MQLGSLMVTFIPHYIASVGVRAFLVLDNVNVHVLENLTLEDLRTLETRVKLAILEAEALERKAQRRRA